MTLAAAADYWTQWGASPNAFFNIALFITGLALLLTLLSSTALGIALLRRGMRPRTPVWLLVLQIPLGLGIAQVTSPVESRLCRSCSPSPSSAGTSRGTAYPPRRTVITSAVLALCRPARNLLTEAALTMLGAYSPSSAR